MLLVLIVKFIALFFHNHSHSWFQSFTPSSISVRKCFLFEGLKYTTLCRDIIFYWHLSLYHSKTDSFVYGCDRNSIPFFFKQKPYFLATLEQSTTCAHSPDMPLLSHTKVPHVHGLVGGSAPVWSSCLYLSQSLQKPHISYCERNEF